MPAAVPRPLPGRPPIRARRLVDAHHLGGWPEPHPIFSTARPHCPRPACRSCVRAAWNAGGGGRGVPAGSNPAGPNIDDVPFVALAVHEVSARSVEASFWHFFAAHPRAGGRLLWADVMVGGEQV